MLSNLTNRRHRIRLFLRRLLIINVQNRWDVFLRLFLQNGLKRQSRVLHRPRLIIPIHTNLISSIPILLFRLLNDLNSRQIQIEVCILLLLFNCRHFCKCDITFYTIQFNYLRSLTGCLAYLSRIDNGSQLSLLIVSVVKSFSVDDVRFWLDRWGAVMVINSGYLVFVLRIWSPRGI